MDLLSIGRFARLSGLTVRALRHYGELGLLSPAAVDEETGYRLYTRAQLADADAIRRLRSLAFPLEEIGEILRTGEAAFLDGRLRRHRARIEQRAEETRRILAELDRVIDRKEPLVPAADVLYELSVETYPEYPVLSIRARVHADEAKHAIPAAYKELFDYLRELGEEAVEPWTITVCPFADEDGTAELETAVVARAPLPGRPHRERRSARLHRADPDAPRSLRRASPGLPRAPELARGARRRPRSGAARDLATTLKGNLRGGHPVGGPVSASPGSARHGAFDP